MKKSWFSARVNWNLYNLKKSGSYCEKWKYSEQICKKLHFWHILKCPLIFDCVQRGSLIWILWPKMRWNWICNYVRVCKNLRSYCYNIRDKIIPQTSKILCWEKMIHWNVESCYLRNYKTWIYRLLVWNKCLNFLHHPPPPKKNPRKK